MSRRSNNTRVLIAIPVAFIGGTEIHTLNLVRALALGGYDVSLCCYYKYDNAMVSEYKQAGAETILMGVGQSEGLLALFVKLIRLFRTVKAGIVHVQYIAPGLIPIVAAKVARVKKVFATVHQPGRIYGLKEKILIRIAAYLCNVFFCNSRAVEDSWFGDSQVFDPEKMDLKRRHFTIYNGVDTERIDKIGKEVDKERTKDLLGIKGKKVIGVVGRLRGEKGQATLLESMKTVAQELPEAVLVVIGDGPDRQYLEEVAKKFRIDGHVKWLGQKDHEEALALYSIMDLVVVPSLFEGFGLTATEAMAAGKPVVASNVDGLSEVVQDGKTALLVEAGDKVTLSRAIIELLSDPGKAALMGARGREFVQKNFSLERFQSAILSAYSRFSQA